MILAAGTIHSAQVADAVRRGRTRRSCGSGGSLPSPICVPRCWPRTCRTMCSSPAWSTGTGGRSPTALQNPSNGVEAEVYLPGQGGRTIQPTSARCSSNSRSQRRKRQRPLPPVPPKKVSRSRRPWFSPLSRGQVRLASANWRDAPVIEANHLGTDHDVNAIVKAIEAARELGGQSAFDQMREAEVIPGPHAASRQDMIDLARTASASFGHAVGTAKIDIADADARGG